MKADLDRISAELAVQNDALEALRVESDKAIALLKEDNERLKRERDEAKEKAKELLASAEAGGSKGAGSSRDENAGANPKQLDLRGMMQGFAKRMDDPETRKMMKQGQERMITAAYDALFKKLGLNDQEIESSWRNSSPTAISRRSTRDEDYHGCRDRRKPARHRAKDIDATKAEYDAKLKSVLGEQKFTELTAYEQTVGDQRALDSFDRNFKSKNQPLAPEQKNALADIMRRGADEIAEQRDSRSRRRSWHGDSHERLQNSRPASSRIKPTTSACLRGRPRPA